MDKKKTPPQHAYHPQEYWAANDAIYRHDILRIRQEARQQALQDACKAVCECCYNDVPLFGDFHNDGVELQECWALQIRALMEPKEGQTGCTE